jgi:TRAP-type transport system small permease protein
MVAVNSNCEGMHTVQSADPDLNVPGAPEDKPRDSLVLRIAFGLGGLGLMGATLADALAVAGRHTGLSLLGSIEIVQACVVLLASAGMFVVTARSGHAAVHFVLERVAPVTAGKLTRMAALLSGLAFVVIAAGSALVLSELWNGHEQTELLAIPLRWLRLLWVLIALAIAALFFRMALVRRP